MSLLLVNLGPPGALWSPSQLPGIQPSLQVALSRAKGKLWQDAAKTVPAVANGDPVYVATCPFTGKDFTAANTSTARPLLHDEGSGHWSLAFTQSPNTASFLNVLAAPIALSGGARYVVLKDTGSTRASDTYGECRYALAPAILGALFYGGPPWSFITRTDSLTAVTQTVTTSLGAGAHQVGVLWDGANATVRYDEAQVGTASALTGTITLDRHSISGGAVAGDFTSFGILGHVYASILVSSTLSAANRGRLEAYLAKLS